MNRKFAFQISALLISSAVAGFAAPGSSPVAVTASNASANQLLVYDVSGNLLQTVPTQGQGGVSGNAGGIASDGEVVAVVNFGSKSVSIFMQDGAGFHVRQVVPALTNPVSVAFGAGHLYILGTTKVESHRMTGPEVSNSPDGVAGLLKADGSAAQVGVLPDSLIISEKSNVIETVALSDGAVSGGPVLVQNIPSNVNAPFGLVTRGDDAYVTIAHADEISLVRNGAVLTVTPSMTQHAPCWLALEGPFLFSSNSPSMTISRYAVYGQKIVQDAAVAAQLSDSPTDIAIAGPLLAVIHGAGSVSHISIFSVDEDGNLAMKGTAAINSPANGVVLFGAGR